MTTVVSTMDKKAYFRAYLQVYLKTFLRALLAVGILAVLCAIEFFVDYKVNGADKSWGVTGSLMWLLLVAAIAVAAYGAFLPLTAWTVASTGCKKNPSLLSAIEWRYDTKALAMKTADGEKTEYEWKELRVYKNAKEFLILRDKQKRYLLLQKSDWTEEGIAALLAAKKSADDKDFYEQNPVSAEAARKAGENAQAQAAETAQTVAQEADTKEDEENGEKEESKKDGD